MKTGPNQKPNGHDSFERGLDPWHSDAFPDEFKAAAPRRGVRQSGWFLIDWAGNAIGFVPDGTEVKSNA